MKRNRIYIVVMLLLAAVAIYLFTQNHYSTLKAHESDFSVRDTASVSKVFIADKGVKQLVLDRTTNGWQINGKYQANQRVVNALLGTLRRIKVKAPVSHVSFDNVLSRMAAIGLKVEIYQEVYRIDWFNKIKLFPYQKLTKVFYVGDVTANNLGTYMMMEGATQPYITYVPGFRGFLSSRFVPNIEDWKSHEVFKHSLADIKSVQFNMLETPEQSFKVEVKGNAGHYKLTQVASQRPVMNYDTLKVLNLLTSFVDVRYESRMNNSMSKVRIDSVVQSPGLFELILVDVDNDTTYLKMFKKGADPDQVAQAVYSDDIPVDYDRFYGLANDGEDFVLLQYFVFDKLLKPLSYYEK